MDYTDHPEISQQATFVTHVHLKSITGDHQSLKQQHAGSIANETVSFHLSQTETTIPGTTLCRLPASQKNYKYTFFYLILNYNKNKRQNNKPFITLMNKYYKSIFHRTHLHILPSEYCSRPRALACILSSTMCFSFLIIDWTEVDCRLPEVPKSQLPKN